MQVYIIQAPWGLDYTEDEAQALGAAAQGLRVFLVDGPRLYERVGGEWIEVRPKGGESNGL